MRDKFSDVVMFFIIVFCLIYTFISILSVFLGKTKLINTSKNVHIVETFESDTFKVYSSVRTIKVK